MLYSLLGYQSCLLQVAPELKICIFIDYNIISKKITPFYMYYEMLKASSFHLVTLFFCVFIAIHLYKLAVQSPSRVWLFATPWTAACQISLSLTISQSLPKFMFIALVMLFSHLILWLPLLLLPSIFPNIRNFSNESPVHITWPKYWSFSFSISPSSEYSGLICLKIDRLDLLAVQGTLKSPQYHSSKALILWHSAFFTIQLSPPYMTTGNTIALTIWTFVGRPISLLFNTV